MSLIEFFFVGLTVKLTSEYIIRQADKIISSNRSIKEQNKQKIKNSI